MKRLFDLEIRESHRTAGDHRTGAGENVTFSLSARVEKKQDGFEYAYRFSPKKNRGGKSWLGVTPAPETGPEHRATVTPRVSTLERVQALRTHPTR